MVDLFMRMTNSHSPAVRCGPCHILSKINILMCAVNNSFEASPKEMMWDTLAHSVLHCHINGGVWFPGGLGQGP